MYYIYVLYKCVEMFTKYTLIEEKYYKYGLKLFLKGSDQRNI